MKFDYFYPEQAEQFAFFRIPKILFRDKRFKNISTDAKVLYGLMLDRVSLSVKNKWIDDKERIYIIFTLEEIMEELDCANQKATKLVVELENKAGLIERKRQGLGKPTLIYVKNFSSEITGESQNAVKEDSTDNLKKDEKEQDLQSHDFHESLTHENHDSGIMETMKQESRKSWSNKTEYNKTDFNDTDPFLSSEEGEGSKGTEESSGIKDLLWEQVMMDKLLQERPGDRDLLMEILQLLVDTLCTRRKTVRIVRDDKPAAEVRRQLLQLGPEHIRFVLDCMAENTTKIKNMRQYLLAALYNAPMTINSYYASLAQHDIAAGKI